MRYNRGSGSCPCGWKDESNRRNVCCLQQRKNQQSPSQRGRSKHLGKRAGAKQESTNMLFFNNMFRSTGLGNHAWKVKQPGSVTRWASGCSEEQARTLTEFRAAHIETMLDKFHLHLTPDYSRIWLDKGRFAHKYMNKPFVVLDCKTCKSDISTRRLYV
jgi:hypothetical protein